MKKILLSLLLISSVSPAFAVLNLFDGADQNVFQTNTSPGTINWGTENYTLGSVNTTRSIVQNTTSGINVIQDLLQTNSGLRYLNISNGSDTSHVTSVVYGGYPGSVAMNLDLSVYGNAFSFTHADADQTDSATVTFSIVNNGVSKSSAPLTLTGANPGGLRMTTVYNVPFSSFPVGTNFTDVDKLTFSVNSKIGADLGIANLQVVPEPSGIVLLSTVTGAFLLRRRRR